MTTPQTDDQVRSAVQERYASAARLALVDESASCCGGSSCCEEASKVQAIDPITSGNYDEDDTPFTAALAASLGCGNPTALAELCPGEDVLDLGSGGGLDVLLSARRIAPSGVAYGLDMTPEMLELAERHRVEAGIENARFMLGSIEQVPLPDQSVDVVISNCVINLSPDKDAVLREAHRVLRPHGRFAVSDIVLLREIPAELRSVMALWTGCISGSLLDSDYVAKLEGAGFVDASVEVTKLYDSEALTEMADQLDPSHLPDGFSLADAVQTLDGAFASAFIRATKPGTDA
ncbi:arsenite methyltransferase [Aestuariimicrobium ganziense]|uniref:arsenite methyltransferase n=1 Tax=Aestuariimicrobium ganziense TaxID=2773677 RepID=UPI0019446208|nr:arsenite methyltransferase [Aestuariimicrobium ganziense]